MHRELGERVAKGKAIEKLHSNICRRKACIQGIECELVLRTEDRVEIAEGGEHFC